MKLKHGTKRDIFFLVLFILGVALVGYSGKKNQGIIEPARAIAYPQTEKQQIESYIGEVFGVDSPKAFDLLQSPKCHENKGLTPDAQNYNSDGSVDIGIFQINSYWQKIQPKFLYNWKINILVAKQLFDENNKSFKLWTCGKVLGI